MLRLLLLLICCVPSLLAAEDLWMTDFEAAKAKAKAEQKNLLIDFTGSDWCHWCIKLKEEVFDHDSFKTAAAERYILVELDYPKDKEQSEAIKAQNEKLQAEYEIQGFPTILLTDADGVVFGRTGYQAGGPEKYIEHLHALTAEHATRTAALKEAESLEGMAKVEKLGAVLTSLIDAGLGNQKAIAEQIKSLDPDDSKGYWDIYTFPQKLEKVSQQLQTSRDLDAALTELTTLIGNTAQGRNKMQAYMFMAQIYEKGKNDTENQFKSYKMAADADPESEMAKSIYEFLEKNKASDKE